jgi:hypothetical protein
MGDCKVKFFEGGLSEDNVYKLSYLEEYPRYYPADDSPERLIEMAFLSGVSVGEKKAKRALKAKALNLIDAFFGETQ